MRSSENKWQKMIPCISFELIIQVLLLFPLQRSAWVRWRSAAPSCHATFRAWCSGATNAPSRAPATRRCSCTCRSTPRSSPTSASSATTTAVGGASSRSIYALSTRSATVHRKMRMKLCVAKFNAPYVICFVPW